MKKRRAPAIVCRRMFIVPCSQYRCQYQRSKVTKTLLTALFVSGDKLESVALFHQNNRMCLKQREYEELTSKNPVSRHSSPQKGMMDSKPSWNSCTVDSVLVRAASVLSKSDDSPLFTFRLSVKLKKNTSQIAMYTEAIVRVELMKKPIPEWYQDISLNQSSLEPSLLTSREIDCSPLPPVQH